MTPRQQFALAALQAMHGRAADIFVASLMRPEDCPPGQERDYIRKRIDALVGACFAIADEMVAWADEQSDDGANVRVKPGVLTERVHELADQLSHARAALGEIRALLRSGRHDIDQAVDAIAARALGEPIIPQGKR